MPKIRAKEIKDNIATFGELYKTYGDWKSLEKTLEEINSMSTVTIDASKGDTDAMQYVLGNEKLPNLPVATNFIGNPFYSFGMYLVDLDIKNIERLTQKKNLIVLKVLELKQLQERDPSDETAKQIEFYQNEVDKIEYKIAKLKES